MAEITQHDNGQKNHKVRVKKMPTRIDMTPMVDLAFLLLTFFILTSTFMHRNTLQVDMPENVKDSTSLPRLSENHVLTLALTENDKLYWWMGDSPQAYRTSYAKDGIRKVLLDRAAADKDLFVLIKPKDNSRYENIIDILDEIDITHTTRFTITAFTGEDDARIAAIQEGGTP